MRELAQGIASLGRGPDTTLVHMSQPEVDALQQIAKAQGGSLTINPQTGLAEAGFLSSALPIIGTVAGSMMGMPWLGAVMSGVGTMMSTGSVGKGILSGLGSWGMGQAFGAMAGAGANPLEEATKQAITNSTGSSVAADAAMQGFDAPGAMNNFPGLAGPQQAAMAMSPQASMGEHVFDPQGEAWAPYNEYGPQNPTAMAAQSANPQVVAQQQVVPMQENVFDPTGRAGNPTAQAEWVDRNAIGPAKTMAGRAGNTWDGIKQAGSPGGLDNIYGRLANNGKYAPDASILGIKGTEGMGNAATLGLAGLGAYQTFDNTKNLMNPQRPGLTGLPLPPGMTRQQYDFEQKRNPNWGQPGQAYFDQRFSPVQAAGGGLMMSAGGAYPQDTPNYPMAGIGSQYAQGVGPTPSEMIGGSGDVSINQFGEEAKRMNTGGNVIPGKERKKTKGGKSGDGVLPEYAGVGPYPEDDLDDEYWRYVKSFTGSTKSYDDPTSGLAAGGVASLGTYKAGGLLNGPGDGVSDSIPAVINGPKPQRAALADGEFVIPARVVSEIGNGSTKAGSKRLYAMMDRIEKARKKVKNGQDSGAYRMLPA